MRVLFLIQINFQKISHRCQQIFQSLSLKLVSLGGLIMMTASLPMRYLHFMMMSNSGIYRMKCGTEFIPRQNLEAFQSGYKVPAKHPVKVGSSSASLVIPTNLFRNLLLKVMSMFIHLQTIGLARVLISEMEE
ncbi:hypothetical protein DO97_09670 [Neosynechococcus sphagnicola sy1]|uniref:Uncharacterized protein n=1 Tax=Neosynechococcus sphagnicola sy1 TaxID=1497020 RepID=A0A098TKH0_9CYAN|nr:hypothetical protein DO97_09670 [Neosynechococcus sphagnicola sy1]